MSPEATYDFEQSARKAGKLKSRRDREIAERYAGYFLTRLNGRPSKLDAIKDRDQRQLLIHYCMDVLLNIDWYAGAIRRSTRVQRRWGVLIAVLAVGSLALFALPLYTTTVASAQLGLVIGAIFYSLQVIASLTDAKARTGAFWKASSDLKTSYYALEDSWRGRDPVEGDKLTHDFVAALRAGLATAREVIQAEERAFFETFKSPSDMVQVALNSFDALRSRRNELNETLKAAKQTEESAVQSAALESARRLAEAQHNIVMQRAAVAEQEYLVDEYKNDPQKQALAQEELTKARARLKNYMTLLEIQKQSV